MIANQELHDDLTACSDAKDASDIEGLNIFREALTEIETLSEHIDALEAEVQLYQWIIREKFEVDTPVLMGFAQEHAALQTIEAIKDIGEEHPVRTVEVDPSSDKLDLCKHGYTGPGLRCPYCTQGENHD